MGFIYGQWLTQFEHGTEYLVVMPWNFLNRVEVTAAFVGPTHTKTAAKEGERTSMKAGVEISHTSNLQ